MEIILLALGGLGLFLYAIQNLSVILKDLLGTKARKWLSYCTKNVLLAVLTGIIITILLDSSSAVVIITIVLVNALDCCFLISMYNLSPLFQAKLLSNNKLPMPT